MARLTYNVVTHGVSGKVGDLLQFSQRNGRTIISKIRAKSGKVTDQQQLIRDTFRLATRYAKSAVKNPTLLDIYKLQSGGDITPYNVAVKDFFTAPVITDVNTQTYNGTVGNSVTIKATDDTKVTKVMVKVFDSSGNLVEEGDALQQNDGDLWTYSSTTANSNVAGGKIVVEAQDLPGNITLHESLLP